MAGDAIEKLSTAIHRKKEAKKKEERPTMTFFLSSNDNGKDQLKSGHPWSEELGAPHFLAYARSDPDFNRALAALPQSRVL